MKGNISVPFSGIESLFQRLPFRHLKRAGKGYGKKAFCKGEKGTRKEAQNFTILMPKKGPRSLFHRNVRHLAPFWESEKIRLLPPFRPTQGRLSSWAVMAISRDRREHFSHVGRLKDASKLKCENFAWWDNENPSISPPFKLYSRSILYTAIISLRKLSCAYHKLPARGAGYQFPSLWNLGQESTHSGAARQE